MLKEPLHEEEYADLASLNHSTLVQMLNIKGPAFKKLGKKAEDLDDQQSLSLMMANPRLMVRPVLVRGDQVITGFKEDEYIKLFS